MQIKNTLKNTYKKFLNFLVIIACCLLTVSCSGKTYESVTSPYPLKQLGMCDAQTGWGLTLNNEILYTENGIEKFEIVRTVEDVSSSSDKFVSAAFVDAQTAYFPRFSADNEHLIVERTKDGGTSWQQTIINYQYYSAACDAGKVYISFAGDTQGYLLCCSTPALGQMTKLLFFTDNGGVTFSFVKDLTATIQGYPQGITAVSDEVIDIAVTYHGVDSYLYQTTDGADTWESVEIFSRENDAVNYVDGYAPVFYGSDRQKGIIILKTVREDAVYQFFTTVDMGKSWIYAGDIPCESLRGYSFAGENEIYIIDDTGQLYSNPVHWSQA